MPMENSAGACISDELHELSADGMESGNEQTEITAIRNSIERSPTNQGFLRDYWAAKKREQRRRERQPSIAPGLLKARSKKNICSAVARCWRKQVQGLSLKEQKEVFQQLMNHQTFSEVQTSNFNKIEDIVLSGVRNSLSQLKVPHSASELFVKRTSLTMILNSTTGATSINQSRIASVLGIHRRNVAAASFRLENKDEDEVLPLSACQRQLP